VTSNTPLLTLIRRQTTRDRLLDCPLAAYSIGAVNWRNCNRKDPGQDQRANQYPPLPPLRHPQFKRTPESSRWTRLARHERNTFSTPSWPRRRSSPGSGIPRRPALTGCALLHVRRQASVMHPDSLFGTTTVTASKPRISSAHAGSTWPTLQRSGQRRRDTPRATLTESVAASPLPGLTAHSGHWT
jgi:hypothetical protein